MKTHRWGIPLIAMTVYVVLMPFGVAFAQGNPTPQPGLAQEYYQEGVFYGKQGKYVEAVMALEKAIELNPANADAYNALGVVYHRQKQSAKAQEYYLLAVEADPSHAKARTNLAMIYAEQQQPDKAIRQLEQALKSRPDYQPAQSLRDKIMRERSEQAAKEHARQQEAVRQNTERKNAERKDAVQPQPQPSPQPRQIVVTRESAPAGNPIFRSGTALALSGELDAAIQSYRRGLAREPRSAEGYVLLAMVYREKFRMTEEERWRQHEVKAFATALQYQPDFAPALLGLGELYYEQGQRITARAYFEQALHARPDHPAKDQVQRILQGE